MIFLMRALYPGGMCEGMYRTREIFAAAVKEQLNVSHCYVFLAGGEPQNLNYYQYRFLLENDLKPDQIALYDRLLDDEFLENLYAPEKPAPEAEAVS